MIRSLEIRKLGTNQVESNAITRQWEREVKKGFQHDRKGFLERNLYKRDQKYIEGLMKLRSSQAKEDWLSIRNEYRELKGVLSKACRESGKLNLYKRKVKKMQSKYRTVYETGCAKNENKIRRLEAKHCSGCRNKSEIDQQSLRDQWFRKIAKGNGTEGWNIPRTQTPVYGSKVMI